MPGVYQVFTRDGRGEGAAHLGEGAEQQVRGVRLVGEHAFEEFGVLRDGGSRPFQRAIAAASPTALNFSEGGEGVVGVGEKSVQHSSQSNQYWVLRVRIARGYLTSAPTCTRYCADLQML